MKNHKNTKLILVLTTIAGAFAMLFCFPFLWSNNLVDVVGAGLPFIAGSILLGAGLISISKLNQTKD